MAFYLLRTMSDKGAGSGIRHALQSTEKSDKGDDRYGVQNAHTTVLYASIV